MSTTIDQKVVSMQFDNRQFERNVQTSLGTLGKLKESLNFSGATKGLEGLGAAANKCDMSGLSNGVEAVRLKFSALQVMAVTALTNITNSAVNAGKRIASSLTIEPIKMGFSEYETQLNAVQTILANTQSKGSTLEDVNGALDELNTYADKTIYNFTEMTRNIGTFTAAGVDLDKSVTSIKGIANLAAVSGSSSQQASTAMYQLSQALAAGKVSLMDWNSVVNAGMGGQVFQDALKRTAEHMGTDVDALIKKYGSFRESLTEGEWLTADVLTETLTQLSGAYSEADLIAQGYSKEQAKQIVELADTAVNAATKVKTFTQLIDTTKEALQSGWTSSWEIIIGDFEEAKELWTNVSDFLNEVISKSAESRNNMLQGWKDAGGRDMAIDAIKNAFQGLLNIIKPISEAFREVFPPMTSEKLLEITERVKELTAKFREASENAGPKLKATFKGIFSVIKMGIDVVTTIVSGIFGFVGAISGLGGGVLTVTGALGNWLSKLSETGEVTEVLGNIFGKINEAIALFVRNVQVKLTAPGFEGFLGIMDRLWNVLSKIGSKIVDIGSSIAESLVGMFRSGDINAGMDLFNSGLFAGLLMGLKKYVDNLTDPFEKINIFDRVKGILDNVKDSLESYQQSLQSETLKKIATAIAILAASIALIAMIDPKKLAASLGAITVLFADLMASMAVFNTIGGAYPKAVKAVTVMLGISSSVLILAAALKTVSSLSLTELATGLVGVFGLTAIVIGAAKIMASGGKTIVKGAGQMILMAAALKIMASVCSDLSQYSWTELAKGLAGMAGMMVGLVASMKLMSGAKFGASSGVGIVLLATSMKILASAVGDFGSMKLTEIGKGLLAMAGALAAITLAMRLMPKNMISAGTGMVVISSALIILSKALNSMGSMKGDTIAKGLTVLGTSMVILALGLNAMKGTLAGSAAMMVAVGALMALTPVLKILGGMSWSEIAKGLLAIGGAFAIMGVAATVLSPIVPVVLSLAGAMALLGVACLGIGAGLSLFATGLIALATAAGAGATAIVAALTTIVLGIAGLIPAIAARFGEAIVVFCQVIAQGAPAIGEAVKALVLTLVDVLVQCIPTIADGALKLISGLLASLAEYTPQIVESLFQFVIGLINALAAYLPDFIQSAVNLISQFFTGIVQALASLDFSTVVSTIAGIGLFAALFMALSALSSLIPGAMVGVLGMGVLVAELGLVLAAIGLLAQIPGLQWLISEGGQFLQTVGTAIGQFVGGIIGGFAQGVSSSFPQIGADLSAFMTNLQPFIAGAKGIDSTMTEGVKAIAETILILTAADILNGLTSWLTGGSSLADFGAQLVPFGKAIASYAKHVAGLDSAAVAASIVTAKHLVKLADIIPNSGGLASIFAGDNDMGDFASKIVSFGKGLAKYSNTVAGVNSSAVNKSISSARNVVKFIKSLDGFSGSTVTTFKNALDTLGKASVNKFVNAFTSSTNKLVTAGSNMMNAVVKGMKSKQASLTDVIKNVIEKVLKNLTSKKTAFKNAGTALITQFVSGFNTNQSKITQSTTKLLSNLVTKIRNKYKSFYNAGLYLVSGFANGITANTYKAEARARAMAAAADRAARKELGIHSPSKVGEETGGFYGEGFVGGVEGTIDDSYKVGSEMAAAVTDGVVDGQEDYWKALMKMKKSGKAVDIFSAVSSQDKKKGSDLTKNLEDQIKQMEEYSAVMTSLKTKLDGTSLFDVISEKGMDSLSDLKAINNMTADELGKYVELYDKNYEMTQNIYSSTQEFQEGILNDTIDILSKYTDELQTNTDALMKRESIFEAVAEQEAVTGSQLTQNLQGQIDQLNQYAEVMASLRGKLYGTSLADAVADMGMDSLAQLTALNEMTAVELNKYVELYDEKYAMCQVMATNQLSGLKRETEDELSELYGGAAVDLDDFLSTFDGTFESIDKYVSQSVEAGAKLASGIATGIANNAGQVQTQAVNTANTAVNASTKVAKSQSPNIGYQMVAGFARGITQNTYMAEARSRAMARAAARAAEEELDINSPSKVGYRIGDFFGLGFVNAIGDAASTAYKASANMAGSARDGLNDALAKVRGLINGDLDVIPTITPVLDLSEIQNGASQISGLFANQSVALAGANTGYGNTNNMASVIEAIQSKSDYDNSEVVKAIDELRSDFGTLVEAINGMHIRMDSGAVVGQLIGKIDNSLGQIAIHKGRGN